MGMTLLKKLDVDRQKQVERQQLIDEGKKLATRVDTLRELNQEEEKSLTEFRNRTVAVLQKEIDSKIAEKDSLGEEIRNLKLQRAELMMPLDSKWAEVNRAQALVSKREDYCTSREAKTGSDNQINLFTAQYNDKKARELATEEKRIGVYASESVKIREEADKILVTNKEKAAQKTQLLARREKEIDDRNAGLDRVAAGLKRFNDSLHAKEKEVKQREQDALIAYYKFTSPIKTP